MLIANYVVFENNQYNMELCLIPHRFSEFSPPIKVDQLDSSEAAVYWIGHGESVSVKIDAQERAKIIEPMKPAILFITAPTDDQPGIKVAKIKVVYLDNKKYELYYDREGQDDWKRFVANLPRGGL